MDDLKIFAKNETETKGMFSQDFGLELKIMKCAILVMYEVKQEAAEGIKIPKTTGSGFNQEE